MPNLTLLPGQAVRIRSRSWRPETQTEQQELSEVPRISQGTLAKSLLACSDGGYRCLVIMQFTSVIRKRGLAWTLTRASTTIRGCTRANTSQKSTRAAPRRFEEWRAQGQDGWRGSLQLHGEIAAVRCVRVSCSEYMYVGTTANAGLPLTPSARNKRSPVTASPSCASQQSSLSRLHCDRLHYELCFSGFGGTARSGKECAQLPKAFPFVVCHAR